MDIDSRSVMGVVVPVVESEISQRTIVERGYGFMDTSVKLDEAAKNSKNPFSSLSNWVRLKTIMLLASEIESTKRRVNALEHIIIPDWRTQSSTLKCVWKKWKEKTSSD